MESARNKVVQFEREIRNHIVDSFVWRHIEEPIIDEDKIAAMLLLLSDADATEQQQSNYILSIMLMQIALDTHENVTNEMNSKDSDELRTRQLTILAGDYYSGLYYHILAKTEDVRFIKEFSRGIQEINESKVELYQSRDTSADFLYAHLETIETALAEKVSTYFGNPCHLTFIKDFLLMKRVNREFASYEIAERGAVKKPCYYAAMLLPPFLNKVEELQHRVEQRLDEEMCRDMAQRARRALDESRGLINNMMEKGLFG